MAHGFKKNDTVSFVPETQVGRREAVTHRTRFSDDLGSDSLDLTGAITHVEERYKAKIAARETEALREPAEKIQPEKDTAFYHEFVVTLKDVNMYGTVYFSRYFEWQGIARELYVATAENIQKILSGTILITKYAWNDYIKHIHVFDHLVVKVQNRNIKRCSYEVMFTFMNKKTNEVVALGGQTICFADNKTGRIIKLPDAIVKGASKNLYKE